MTRFLRGGTRQTAVIIAVAISMLLGACAATGSPGASAIATRSAAPTTSSEPAATTLRTVATATGDDPQLTVGAELSANDTYTTHAATYTSEGLTISAVISEPLAPGPHAGMVLVHGFVDPESYTSGGELQREQDVLARAGYIVLNTDLRGLAGSDPAPEGPPDLEMGATMDVVNAVRALAASGLPGLDSDRIGLLGHSLGGLLVLDVLAATPGLVDAVVAFAPSSTDRWEDVEHYLTPGEPPYDEVVAAHGTPETNPRYWADISPDTFVDQITEPLLVVHGDADVDSPYQWSVDMVAAWQGEGKDVELLTLPGEGHVFDARFDQAMDAVNTFFASHLH